MAALLFGHMRDFAPHRVAIAEHGKLAGIDPGGTIFTGLIDTDHARYRL